VKFEASSFCFLILGVFWNFEYWNLFGSCDLGSWNLLAFFRMQAGMIQTLPIFHLRVLATVWEVVSKQNRIEVL